MSQAEASLSIGEMLDGRYRIVSEGAAGGCWRTYVAYDDRQGRLVVLTVLARQLGTDIVLLERIARVNQAVAGLAGPGLVPYDRAGAANGQVYLVRPHLEGQSLRQRLDESGFMEPEAAAELAVRLCETLAPLHRAGLAHGGLSPDTIWLGAGQNAALWVVDCGLFPALGPAVAVPDRSRARFPYLAPEQAAGQDGRAAADVYTIGLIVYEALTGRPPLAGGRPDPVPLENRVPHLPPSLSQIVNTALKREPSMRYRNAGQLAHLLRDQLEALRVEAAGVAPAPAGGPASQMVVPAPTGQAREPAAEPVYYPDFEQERWAAKPAPIDWVLVALIVAALIAMLGLIPLWRTVQRLYRPTGAGTAPTFYRTETGMPAWAMAAPGLEISRPIWYNSPVEAERERKLEKLDCLPVDSDGGRNAVHVDLSGRQSPRRRAPVQDRC